MQAVPIARAAGRVYPQPGTSLGILVLPVARPSMASEPDRSPEAYWRANLRAVLALLLLWFLASFGAGILWVDALDRFRLPGSGFPVGFWFAQQGSILVFVLLIAAYVRIMNRIDRKYRVEEDGE